MFILKYIKKRVMSIFMILKSVMIFYQDYNNLRKDKKIIIYHMPLWIFYTKTPDRIINYMKVADKMYPETNKIRINLESYLNLKMLQAILNGKKKISFSCLIIHSVSCIILESLLKKNSKIKFQDFSDIPTNGITYAIWDISLRDITVRKNNHKNLPISKEIYYENIINTYSKNFEKYSSRWLNLIRDIFSLKKVIALSTIQFSYQDQILMTLADEMDIPVIMFESLFSELTIFEPSTKSKIKRISENNYIRYFNSINTNELTLAEKTLENRVKGKYDSLTMGYMNGISLEYKALNVNEDGNICILFLHAFTDAPNYMRSTHKDSVFLDYYTHALDIIEYVLSNRVPLLIKKHPASKKYKNDIPLIKALISRSEKLSRQYRTPIWWLDEKTSNETISNINNIFAITARGSVILECAYLGIPVCITVEHQWENFSFVKNARNKRDLMSYINNPFEGYDKVKAKNEVIRLQAFIESKNWKDRPSCISLYNYSEGNLSEKEINELIRRSLII